jgi:spore maturation protein CgeB
LINKVVGNGMEDFFEEDRDYLAFSNEQELKEKAVRLIASPDMRRVVSESARTKVLAMHTYRNRLNTVLATLGYDMLKNV